MSAPRVSVIMRTKDCDHVVDQALAGLACQDFRDYELVVIDSGSSDRTLDMVARHPCRLIRIRPEEYYPGPVLNRAIEASRGEILVFQNSDVVPLLPTTLGRLVAALDAPEVAAAYARQLPRPEADTWVRRDYAAAFPAEGAAPAWLPYSLPLAAMRRDAWAKHRFYDAAWGSEDTEWGVWARRAGLEVRYVPDALVMHSHNYTLPQLYGRRFIEGEADAFIYGGVFGVLAAARGVAGAVARDLAVCARAGDVAGAAMSLPRRAVFQYGYWKGRRHGAARVAQADADASVGQRVVLGSYGR